ncbi:MAG: pilus assembly protein TadG-related protein [Pseudomonadota bacterium]
MNVVRNENGSLTIFTVITFTVMIMLAGFAVDTANVEMERSKIQATIDHAALAAASLEQSVDPITGTVKTPKQVVDLYMAKANVSQDFIDSYQVVEDETTEFDTERSVFITGNSSVSTTFMKMMGIDSLDFSVSSAAMESELMPTEISLVLDISGSMLGDVKLGSLKTGAQQFVTAMLQGNTTESPHNVSINLVPYSTYVNVGKDLSAVVENSYKDYSFRVHEYIAPHMNNEGMCGTFKDTAFDNAEVWSSDDFIPLMTFGYYNFTPENGYLSGYGLTGKEVETPYCPAFEWAEVLPMSADEVEINGRIAALQATTQTSTDDGARWGVVLLDPSMQSTLAKLMNNEFTNVSGFDDSRFYDVEVEEVVVDDDGNPVAETEIVDGEEVPVVDGFGQAVYETVMVTQTNVENDRQRIDPGFTGRPKAYADPNDPATNVSKIMVLMTDGYNTSQYTLKDKYSQQWNGTMDTESDHASYTDSEGATRYFYWRGSDQTVGTDPSSDLVNESGDNTGYEAMTWQDLFAVRPVYTIASYDSNYSIWEYMKTYTSHSGKNTRMHNICSAAKLKGVTIYTIAYEVDDYTSGLLETCATPGAHYEATSETITSVFGNIAQSAKKLQLTQ